MVSSVALLVSSCNVESSGEEICEREKINQAIFLEWVTLDRIGQDNRREETVDCIPRRKKSERWGLGYL